MSNTSLEAAVRQGRALGRIFGPMFKADGYIGVGLVSAAEFVCGLQHSHEEGQLDAEVRRVTAYQTMVSP